MGFSSCSSLLRPILFCLCDCKLTAETEGWQLESSLQLGALQLRSVRLPQMHWYGSSAPLRNEDDPSIASEGP